MANGKYSNTADIVKQPRTFGQAFEQNIQGEYWKRWHNFGNLGGDSTTGPEKKVPKKSDVIDQIDEV